MTEATEFKIEKGIRVPDPVRYPWDELKVGDSFFVPGATAAKMGGSLSYQRRKHPDRKFTSCTVDGGVRIWRTE